VDIQPATLRRIRQDRALTQQALADKADVTPSYLHKLETGHRARPSEAVVRRLSDTLDVEPYVLRFAPDDATAHLAALALANAKGDT
jgi:transcriptional regulator with XRE-family HTH domain